MEPFEAAAILQNSDMATRDAWERTRVLAYVMAQSNSSKTLSPADVLPLPWDASDGADNIQTMTQEDYDRLRQQTQMMESLLNKNGR